VLGLNVLLDRLGQPGGIYLPPSVTQDGFAPYAPSGFQEVEDLVARMEQGEVDVLMVHGVNGPYELPSNLGFTAALAKVPLVVSFGTAVDEMGLMSDLILPDHANLESWGYHTPTLADRRTVGGLQPVMRPLYDTRSSVDVLLALADRLEGAVKNALPWPNEVAFLKESLGSLWGQSDGADSATWTAFRQRGGWWTEDAEMERPTLQAGAASPATAGSTEAPGADTFPYHLHVYPSISLYDGRGANKSWLQETPDPMTTVAWQSWVEIHPETAHDLGVQDGDVVTVRSAVGEVQALVYTHHGIEPETVAMALGQGHDAYGRFAQGRGSNPIRLLDTAVDGDGTLVWATRVDIVSTGERRALARLESAEGVEHLRTGGQEH
jgi:anaerobic selenocysteine-containing dehydrogenase